MLQPKRQLGNSTTSFISFHIHISFAARALFSLALVLNCSTGSFVSCICISFPYRLRSVCEWVRCVRLCLCQAFCREYSNLLFAICFRWSMDLSSLWKFFDLSSCAAHSHSDTSTESALPLSLSFDFRLKCIVDVPSFTAELSLLFLSVCAYDVLVCCLQAETTTQQSSYAPMKFIHDEHAFKCERVERSNSNTSTKSDGINVFS